MTTCSRDGENGGVVVFLCRAERDSEALTFDQLRLVGAEEQQQIREAIGYCRAYARRLAVRLVFAGQAGIEVAAGQLAEPMPDHLLYAAGENVEVAITSFLLLWRLFLDHARHDLSERFKKDSSEYDRFDKAAKAAYDNHAGYRLMEGLRNYVQHEGMPQLSYEVRKRRENEENSAVVIEVTIGLPRQPLLESNVCPRILKQDLQNGSDVLPILELVQDAMIGVAELVSVLADIDGPELKQHVSRLQGIVDEASPGVPVLVDFPTEVAPGNKISMMRFDDLADLLNLVGSARL